MCPKFFEIKEKKMKLLHIIATPRSEQSNTLQISKAFIDSLHAKHTDLVIEEIDLFNHDIPSVIGSNIEAKYTLMLGQPVPVSHSDGWSKIEALIDQFKSADLYLITAPMWNFTVPYALKFYIDAVIQPGYLFAYNEQGQPYGMASGKMVCITTRGGDYSPATPMVVFDFLEPYLRAIFGFVGISEIHFVNAQPMDITPEWRVSALAKAIEEAKLLGENLDMTLTHLPEITQQSSAISA